MFCQNDNGLNNIFPFLLQTENRKDAESLNDYVYPSSQQEKEEGKEIHIKLFFLAFLSMATNCLTPSSFRS